MRCCLPEHGSDQRDITVQVLVESVSKWPWNECPSQRGVAVQVFVEWVSKCAWNPQPPLEPAVLAVSNLCKSMVLQMLHLTLPFNQKFIPVWGVWPMKQPGRADTCLIEALPPWLRDSLLQDDVDAGMVMLHRDTIPKLVELKCLASIGGVFPFLKVKVIKDG